MFSVTETKLALTDIISVDGYEFNSKSRQQTYIRKSGGIGIFEKSEINRFVEIVNTESNYILWVKFDKNYTKLEQHIIVGIIYVPPSQSRSLNEDEFEIFQNEITDMCSRFDYIYLAGDINAQTADLADYTSTEGFLCRYFDFDKETKEFYDQKSVLEYIGIQSDRVSTDKRKINNGFWLLDICKNNNLTILNGRFGKGKNIGKPTFRGISVIDYTISSIRGLRLLTDFDITELDRLYSDGHALLSCV